MHNFTEDFNFKGLTAQHLYKSLGINGLNKKFEVLMVMNIKIMGCDATWFGTEVRTFQNKALLAASQYKMEEAIYSEMSALLTCLGDITSFIQYSV
jgi:hypothetical protein